MSRLIAIALAGPALSYGAGALLAHVSLLFT